MAELMTEAEAAAAAEWVMVMGMQVPLFLKERMARVGRKRYPELTAGKDDDAACRDVTKFWWVSLMAEEESAEVEAPVAGAVEAIRTEYAQKGKAARLQALRDATLITEPPEPPVEPIPTDPLPGGKR